MSHLTKKTKIGLGIGAVLIIAFAVALVFKLNPTAPAPSAFSIRFATKAEATELMLGHKTYYDNFTPYDLDYKTQKKNATLAEHLAFMQEQIQEFTPAEQAAITAQMDVMSRSLQEKGYKLPPVDTITFVKTTQREEADSGAYTHGTEIYFGDSLLGLLTSTDAAAQQQGRIILWHELFHCLTRCNPDFRAEMYSIIHFTVVPEDYPLPPCIADIAITNPDVEHRNAYATFIIDGQPVDCFLALIATEPFETPGDSFFGCSLGVLVPVDGSDTFYTPDQAANYNEIFGENTNYTIDPEECMADNFCYAMEFGLDGIPYPTPAIPAAIIAALQ